MPGTDYSEIEFESDFIVIMQAYGQAWGRGLGHLRGGKMFRARTLYSWLPPNIFLTGVNIMKKVNRNVLIVLLAMAISKFAMIGILMEHMYKVL